ncbi:MAG: 1-acyl-sn-glycerol-3-phosphate acyltransferase [Rikenellaceae bacterium]
MQIDLNEIVKDKNPALYRKLPRFVLWIAGKILYIKSINRILALFSHLQGVVFIRAMLDELSIRREAVGVEKLRRDGHYLFASNHPLGGLDGLSLVEAIDRRYNGTKILANDILMNLTPLKDVFLPVNKHGRQSADYARQVAEHFEQGRSIIYFPAGLCSRKVKGEITDLEWQRNYVQKAIEYKYDIVPVYVSEINSPLFYNLELWRTKLGLKFNIGMILLPHELFRRSKRKGSVRMIFGEPVCYKELSETHNVSYWNKEIRRRCYELSNDK